MRGRAGAAPVQLTVSTAAGGSPAGVSLRVLAGAGAALAASHAPALRAAPALQRTNHRGVPVTLASGPALALGSVVGAALSLPAAAVAGLVSAAVGGYDDVAGARPAQAGVKGFRGHVGALRHGTVTTGAVKVAGIGLAGLAGCALLPDRRVPLDVLLGGAVVACSANLLNLLDLRPGRALKVGLAVATLLRQSGVAAAAAVLLPEDLTERTMLGDAGANALGAVLGLALVERLGSRTATAGALAALAGLTAASEVVSYSRVIDATPLRWLDRLGRRP